MSSMIADIEHLSQKIGPRPAGTEEEQQAALYIAEELQKSAGFTTVIEDFRCITNASGPRTLCFSLAAICALLPLFLPVLAIPCFIIGFIAAALFILEISGTPTVSRFMHNGVSQNVLAKYNPASIVNLGKRRKIILVARYDSGQVLPQYKGFFAEKLHLIHLIEVGAIVLAPFLLLLRTLFAGGDTGVVAVVFNVLIIICLAVILLPLLEAIMRRRAPYNEGANNNASGVSVLMEIARRVGRGRVELSDMQNNAEQQGVEIHGEEAAREADVLPEDAEVTYATRQRAMSPEESLAAAKAAIAALTGKPIADKVPVSDISPKLVQHGNPQDGEYDLAAAAVHFDINEDGEPQYIAPASKHNSTQVAGDQSQTFFQDQLQDQDQGQAQAQSQGWAQGQDVQAEEAPQPEPEVAAPFIRQPLEQYGSTTSSSFDHTPAWAKSAQEKAHKNRPDLADRSNVKRSRFADAPAAAMDDAARQRANSSNLSSAFIGEVVPQNEAAEPVAQELIYQETDGATVAPVEPEVPQTELGRRLAALREEIQAAEPPHFSKEFYEQTYHPQGTPVDPSIPAPYEPTISEDVYRETIEDTAQSNRLTAEAELRDDQVFTSEPISVAQVAEAVRASETVEEVGKIQLGDEELLEGRTQAIPVQQIRMQEQANSDKKDSQVPQEPQMPEAPIQEAQVPQIPQTPQMSEAVAQEVVQQQIVDESTSESIPEPAPGSMPESPSELVTEPITQLSSEEINQAFTEEPIESSLGDLPTPPSVEDIPTRPVDLKTIQESIKESEEAARAVAPIVGFEDMLNDESQLHAESVVAQDESTSSKQVITLPEIIAPISGTMEDAKQRAPMDTTAKDYQEQNYALLSNMIPRIDQRVSQNSQQSVSHNISHNPTFDLPTLADQGDSHNIVSSTGSFAAVGSANSLEPVGDSLVSGVNPEEVYVEDADDSVFDEGFTESGAYAGKDYVDMPKSRVGSLFGRFRKKKNNRQQPEQGVREWVDVDEDYTAQKEGKERGSWESFRDNDESDWEGGAFSLSALRDRAKNMTRGNKKQAGDQSDLDGFDGQDRENQDFDDQDFVDQDFGQDRSQRQVNRSDFGDQSSGLQHPQASSASERVFSDEDKLTEELTDEMLRLQDFRHPNVTTEIWFLALGAQEAINSGMEAFIAEHRSELKGAIVVNLEALGAGRLSFISEEGSYYRTYKPSSRLKRYLQKASQVSKIPLATDKLLNFDSAAYCAGMQGLQAMTIAGTDRGNMTYFASAEDTIDAIDETMLEQNVRFVEALLKQI